MKRYQVFISSAYEDLVEQRRVVANALLQQSYLPSGMELFPSTPGTTWPYIEEVIRLSDYYVLILDRAYGSAFPEEIRSWTEKEFDFARAIKKPILVFPSRAKDSELSEPMRRFRARIADEQLVRFWIDTADLTAAVLGSLDQALRTHPQPGWVRTDAFLDEEESMLTFYRRSADFDFGPFLNEVGDIRIMLNDGYNWLKRHRQAIIQRFSTPGIGATFVLHVSAQSPMLPAIATKSGKSLIQQKSDIEDFHNELKLMADQHGYDGLEVFGHDHVNTHCLYICKNYAIVTTYFTSDNRFLHLPLYKFRAYTSIFDDFFQDFDLLFREARAAARVKVN